MQRVMDQLFRFSAAEYGQMIRSRFPNPPTQFHASHPPPSPTLTISQVCSLPNPLETDLNDFAGAQCGSMEVWLTKLESFLQSQSEQRFKELLDEHQVTVPVASYQGGLLSSQGEARQVAWDQFRQRLDLCQRLDIATIVVAADAMSPLDQQAIE